MSASVASITALCPTLCIRTVLSALLASACGILTRLPVRYDSGSHFTDEKTEMRFRLKSSPKLLSEDPRGARRCGQALHGEPHRVLPAPARERGERGADGGRL